MRSRGLGMLPIGSVGIAIWWGVTIHIVSRSVLRQRREPHRKTDLRRNHSAAASAPDTFLSSLAVRASTPLSTCGLASAARHPRANRASSVIEAVNSPSNAAVDDEQPRVGSWNAACSGIGNVVHSTLEDVSNE